MMNIGMRPTFDGSKLTLEVNIFNFQGDLYDKQLQVVFIHRIREERKFTNALGLAEQLQKDRLQIEEQFKKEIE